MSRGRIEKALSGFYYVNTGAETLQCRARGKFRREGMSPLVGDWVQVRDLGGGEGFVETVEPRRNVFSRPAAANIDQLIILASAAIPVTEPYLIDRIAAIAALKGCQVLLCLNKCDLNTADELYDIYSHSALPVLRISAETGEGLAALRAAIAGKLNAFTGNSGVGKSSVLNRLLPELHLPVGEVSKALGRGRHTTRHVELFALGGGTYVIDTPGFSSFDTEEMDLELKITGEFNVYNVMGVIGAMLAEKIDKDIICSVLDGFDGVPGRFQLVEAGQPYTLIVDYAHTPDGLENVLKTARSITRGKLWVVFGCGGDRDNKKRPLMGALALELADNIVVTSDNPRTEDPELIIDEIFTALQNVPEGKHVTRLSDRREAICYALAEAAADDVILIAGKGHENYQILKDRTIHFDDKEVVMEYWSDKKC